jgi:hypothetical protein
MAVRKRSWLGLALVIALGFGAWKAWQHFFDDQRGVRNLTNQVWLERLPRNERDMVWATVLLEQDDHQLGIIARGSSWRVNSDTFLWKLNKDSLRTRFPQDNKRYTVRVRTWECAGEAPEPFELCLEIKRGDQTLRFYSLKDWVVRLHEDGPPAAGIAWLAPAWQSARSVTSTEQVGEGPDTDGPGPFDLAN